MVFHTLLIKILSCTQIRFWNVEAMPTLGELPVLVSVILLKLLRVEGNQAIAVDAFYFAPLVARYISLVVNAQELLDAVGSIKSALRDGNSLQTPRELLIRQVVHGVPSDDKCSKNKQQQSYRTYVVLSLEEGVVAYSEVFQRVQTVLLQVYCRAVNHTY